MKLKGLLKLVTGLIVIVPTSLSVVACGGGTATVTKNDLKTITQLSGVNFSLDTNKKYSAFDSAISTATEFNAKPIKDFTVKYYDGATGGADITNQNQTGSGSVYIVITASGTDANWTGTTSDTTRIVINVVGKTNLDTVTTIDDLSSGKYFNPKANYSALDAIIKNANEFKNNTLNSYNVKYYGTDTGGTEITNNNQVAGTVYVVITADGTDANWTGATSNTNRLSFSLNKVNLSTITSLTGLNITVNTNDPYSNLNDQMATATEFKNNTLNSYTVKYYGTDTGGTEITNNNQVAGTVYVVISADSTDPYWTGDTTRIALTINNINKVNLSTITTLTGLNITVSSNDPYSNLNNQIATANEFKANPMQNFTVKYYGNDTGGTEITTNNQVAGTVYVVISADSSDPYWTGATSDIARIAVTINNNKVNLSTITTLTGLNITVSPNDPYSNLNNQIAKAHEFNANPMQNFTVKYYDAVTGGTEITNQNQTGNGRVYIVITASGTDANWTGATSDTNRLYFSLNKVNLSTITTLTGLDITHNPSQQFKQLNDKIATANEFSTNNLVRGYSVAWYSTDGPGASDLSTSIQYYGKLYVAITAASNDPYWTGSSTTKIEVNLK